MEAVTRRTKMVVAAVGALTALLAVSFSTVTEASAMRTAPLKPIPVFDGQRFTAKPATFTGWPMIGTTGVRQDPLITGLKGRPANPGAIRWKYWRRYKAVGVGRGWTPACLAPCNAAYPWDGSIKRITLFRRRGGRFTRAKVFYWTAWGTPGNNGIMWAENYWVKLAFKGRNAKFPWRVIDMDNGIPWR